MAEDNVVRPDFSTIKTETVDVVKLTEDAQGKAFVDIQQGNMRYVEENDQWYYHNSIYWEPISKLSIIETARQMNRKAAVSLNKGTNLKKQLCSRRFAQNVEAYARGDERCLLPIEELDKDPWLLGTPDDIIDLKTGRPIAMGLKPYVTMTTAVTPADRADEHTCPTFLRFMDQFTCGDAELRRYLLQYGGYCLTGDMREQCLIFLALLNLEWVRRGHEG
jgi:putative DNA primase/helicase